MGALAWRTTARYTMAVPNRPAKSEGAKHRRTAESPAAPGGRVEAAGDEDIDVAYEMEAEARGATYSGAAGFSLKF